MKSTDESDDNRAELRAVSDAEDTTPAQGDAEPGWEDILGALQSPSSTSADDTNDEAPSPKRDRKAEKAAKREAREQEKQQKSEAKRKASTSRGPALPAGFSTPAPAPSREPMNPWVKRGGIAVVVIGLAAGAVALGRTVMADQTPVTASPTDTAMSTSVAPPPAPQTSSPSVSNRGLPPDNTTVVSGDCEPSEDQERITPSGKSLRSVIADFQDNYFHDNADALRATISKSNKEWRDQDWDQVLAQITDDASYCVTLQPEQGEAVVSTVRMSVPGESDQIFKQRVVGERNDQGRWLIKAMHPIED